MDGFPCRYTRFQENETQRLTIRRRLNSRILDMDTLKLPTMRVYGGSSRPLVLSH
jgi:hypothetical protein